ncbi:helix-turn-helix domain-containing protein [Phenylobacterium sp.]|uniref:helix-turn-helix domain-containing protein n=1 Tax=Phenylobacterium sp. TaxID=1871053 RepID=UPI0035ADED55
MTSTETLGASLAAVGRGLKPRRPRGRLQVSAAIAAASFVCYILARLLKGDAAAVFSVIGVGACGWAWLVARALFDPAERDAAWALILAGVVAATGALSVLAPAGGLIGRVAGNAYVLSGSAALVLTFVEPFLRWRPDLPSIEKRFRIAFTGGYALLVAASVMDLWPLGEGPQAVLRGDLIKAGCALAGLVAVLAAARFRGRHPLAAAAPPRRLATAEDARLAERLMRMLADEDLAARPELKIGEVAARLGEPEYRVSQCISAALGFANFNRWINHHRIARAKALLADPAERRSILEIAFACGFASLGPFNRAFRDDTGMTPRAYRASSRGAMSSR